MKKMFVFMFFALCGKVFTQSDCTIEEMVLLDERPKSVSMRDAMNILQGKVEKVVAESGIEQHLVSVFPPVELEKNFVIYAYIKSVNGEKRWEQSPRIYGDQLISPYGSCIFWLVVCFVIFFFWSFWIFLEGPEDHESRGLKLSFRVFLILVFLSIVAPALSAIFGFDPPEASHFIIHFWFILFFAFVLGVIVSMTMKETRDYLREIFMKPKIIS